ncbi:signal peptidase complex catalytic subunit SEC11A [Pipra filicauda]|nr:signal peptidase complex catalytic subunit SEC11A [Pipra filicauda]
MGSFVGCGVAVSLGDTFPVPSAESGVGAPPAPRADPPPEPPTPRGGSGSDAPEAEAGPAGREEAAAAAMLSLDFLDDVRRMNKRQLYYQVLNFGMIVSSALMIWKGLMVVTGSESPIVVVLSGSMEPAFHRGDLLFLTNRIEDPIRVGEIVVFRIEGREIPIVHRVLKIHEKQNGDIKFLTKGDNNAVDDRGLYKRGQHWLEKKDVVGRARGFVPYIGIVTILMNDYPKFKYAVLFLLGLFVLVHRE